MQRRRSSNIARILVQARASDFVYAIYGPAQKFLVKITSDTQMSQLILF